MSKVLKHTTIQDWRGGTIANPQSVTIERLDGYFIDLTIEGKTVRLDAGYLKQLIDDFVS